MGDEMEDGRSKDDIEEGGWWDRLKEKFVFLEIDAENAKKYADKCLEENLKKAHPEEYKSSG